MYCRKCGKEIPDDSKFCAYCGTVTGLAASAGEKSKKSKGLLWTLTIVPVVMLGLFLYNLTIGRQRSEESNNKFISEMARNPVSEPILEGPVSIPAGETRSSQFYVNFNLMSSPVVKGEIRSSGGVGGNLTMNLFYGNQLIYNCERQTTCAIHEDLSTEGMYSLVLDNSGSMMFSRSVSGKVVLQYVKWFSKSN